LTAGQCNGNGARAAVGVGDREISVFCGTRLVPCLGRSSPAGQVDCSAGAVFELERDTVIRPALQADVVSAGCYRHSSSLAFTLATALLTAMVRT